MMNNSLQTHNVTGGFVNRVPGSAKNLLNCPVIILTVWSFSLLAGEWFLARYFRSIGRFLLCPLVGCSDYVTDMVWLLKIMGPLWDKAMVGLRGKNLIMKYTHGQFNSHIFTQLNKSHNTLTNSIKRTK